MVQFQNEVKIDKIRQVCEKIGYQANSNYISQLLRHDFSNDLYLGGCEGVLYSHGNFSCHWPNTGSNLKQVCKTAKF